MAQNTPLSAQAHAATFSKRSRTIALTIVALAFVMDLVDNTIVNIAIPTIRDNLGAGYAAIQWVLAGYALTFATLLVTGGRMGDVYGYKKIFMIGVAGFTIASLLSGLAANPGMLIAARLLQGAFAALMVPQVISLMQVMYPPEERGGINGLFGALAGVGASLGPIIGGILIKANIAGLDWRPIFLINLPVGLFALIAGFKYLPDGKSEHPLKLDLFGTLLIVAAIFLLAFPLIQGRDLGWPTWSFLMMAASLPVLAIFVWWQLRKDKTDGSPLVLPALFKVPAFSIGLVVNLVFEMAMIGYFLTFTLLLQVGFGYDVIHAALTGLPLAFAIAFTMGVAGDKLIPRLGRNALSLGTVLMASGLGLTAFVMHHFLQNVTSWELIPSLVLTGIGMACVFSSLFSAVLSGVDVRHAGSASGVLNAIQQIGAAIGVAIIGVIFFGQLTAHAGPCFDAAAPKLRQQLSAAHLPAAAREGIMQGVRTCYIDTSNEKDSSVVAPSCKATQDRPASAAVKTAIIEAISHTNATNFEHAFRLSIFYDIALLAVTCALSFFLPRKFIPGATAH